MGVVLLAAGCTLNTGSPAEDPVSDEAAVAVVTIAAGTVTREPTATGTLEPTTSPPPTLSPTPTPHVLAVCTGAEPASLMPYLDTSYAARLIQAIIFDAPVDTVGYAYRAGIVREVPSVDKGSAVIKVVRVAAGDLVLDDAGAVVALSEGVRVRPAGCRTTECSVVFDDSDLEMDQMRVLYELSPDLFWADGSPVSAADSVYSFQLASAPAMPQRQAHEVRTESYLAVDDRTVVWTGVPGYLPQAYATIFWSPLPTAWRDIPLADLFQQDEVIRTPTGYGPYALASWTPGEAIRVRRNPAYVRSDGAQLAFDEVRFRFLSTDDPDGALDALVAGDCDLLTQDLDVGRAYQRLLAMEAAGTARLVAQQGDSWEHLTFNTSPVVAGAAPRPAFFADVQARRAAAYCIDRAQVASALTHGAGAVLDTYVPRDHPLYATGVVTTYDANADLGREILTDIGWSDEDGDGVREAHGVPGIADATQFRLRYVTTATESRLMVAQSVSEQLAACGIAVEVETRAPWELFAQNPGGVLTSGDYDLAQVALAVGVHPRCDPYASWAIPSEANGWMGLNVGRYSSSAFDEACALATSALPGEDTYVAAHRDAQSIFASDLPVLPLYGRVKFLAARPELEGLAPDAISVETWNIEAFSD